MTELLKLAERCEVAKMAHRLLDAEIYVALDDERDNHDAIAINGQVGAWVPRFTTSLDAAMTLVPEGCASAIGTMAFANETRSPWACIWTPQGEPTWRSDAATPALALCAAALRAIAPGQSA